MSFVYRIFLLSFTACLLAGSPSMAADLASDPPASLAGSLRAITDFKLDALDAQARDSIQLARRKLNEALQSEPVQSDTLAAAYGELGGLYQVHFLLPAAEDCYHNARQLAPGEFSWVYYAAHLSEDDGRTREALERYEQARKLKPGYKALTVRLGNVLLDLNELERAQAAYEQVVNIAGLEAASLYGLGQIALLKRDYDTAIDAFTRALAVEPAASRIHYPLAQALRATQRNDEARAQLTMRGDEPPSIKDPQIESLESLKIGSRIHFINAMKATRQKDYAAASEGFAQGLAIEPDNVLARTSYARTLYLADDKNGARQALEAALAVQPDNPLGLFLLGVLAEEEGDAGKAADNYRRAIQYAPDHSGAHQYLADQYYHQGNYTAAAQHYASSIRGEPDNLAATIPYMGTLLLSDASAATLMSGLETAIERFPEYPGFRPLQIMLQASSPDAEIRDPEAALKSAQQLNEQYMTPPNQELLALALAATGDYREAITIEENLLSYAQRAMPAEADRVAKTLAYYQGKTLPLLDELINHAALQPAKFNATLAFRDYPAARPY
jgi:tetratricopeptide (TPR) repeat protein